jgi:hypothetical protein
MVHIYHHNGVGLLYDLSGKVGNKLVKRIPVPYASQSVNLGIGFEDKEITVQQGGSQARPYKSPGIQYDVHGPSASGKEDKETNEEDVVFIKFSGRRDEFIHKKCHRKITDDDPDDIQISPGEEVILRNGKIKMKPLVQHKDSKVQRKDAYHDIHEFFCPGSVGIDQIINEDKRKVICRNLEYIINR